MSEPLCIGERLRKLREEKGLTRKGLAARASVTSAYLSKLENEKVSPSIPTLRKIADCLGVSMISFFGNELAEEPCINPPESWTPKRIKGWDMEIRQMVRNVKNKKMCPFFNVIPPYGRAHDQYARPGEKFVYVLEGHLSLNLDGDITELAPGTMAYFSAQVPHTWINNTAEPCKFMWVCSAPNW